MANVLSTGKKIAILSALAQGLSINPNEWMTGVHRVTIMLLLVKVGKGFTAMRCATMGDLSCTRLEMDEGETKPRIRESIPEQACGGGNPRRR